MDHSNATTGVRLLREISYDFLPRVAFTGACAGKGCLRFRYHCCAIPTTLLVRIYTASPLEIGEIMKIAAIEMGMIFIIICCCGSVAVIGVIFETMYMDAPISTGRM